VLDEKMKDAVKITVIATGFREGASSRQRQQETRHSFAASHDDAMDFPEPFGQRDPICDPMSEPRMSESMREDHVFVPDPTPVAMTHASGEAVSLDSMRNAIVANFEQDDLDVPAFLRKRGEVM
jgi:hypothetical protein